MPSGESLFWVPNVDLRTRLWLVGRQVLLSRQITLVVGVGVFIRATIRQVGKQVLLVVVRAESTFLRLYGFHLKTHSKKQVQFQQLQILY